MSGHRVLRERSSARSPVARGIIPVSRQVPSITAGIITTSSVLSVTGSLLDAPRAFFSSQLGTSARVCVHHLTTRLHIPMMHLLYGFVILAYHAGVGLPVPVTYDQRQTGDLNVQLHLKDVTVLALLDSEMLDDYTEYDYFYDYADFTVKPTSKPTTSPTTTISVEASTNTTNINAISEPNTPTNEQNVQNVTNSESVSSEASTNLTNLIESTTKASSSSVLAENTLPLNSSQDSSLLNSTENPSPSSLSENKRQPDTSDIKRRVNDKVENLYEEVSVLTTRSPDNPTTESTNAVKPSGGLRKRCKSGYSPNGRGRCRLLNRRRVSLIPFMKLAPQLLGSKSFDSRNLN